MVRYWNSEKHKISYLGIPKTGSTSVRAALSIDVDRDWSVEPKFATFTVLRHPTDRIKSAYMECKRRGTIKPGLSFTDFLKSLHGGFFDSHTEPQSHYFRPVDRVWLFCDLDKLFVHFKVAPKRENISEPYRIDPTDEDMGYIYSIYGRDFILYQFYAGGNVPHDLASLEGYFKRFYALSAELNNHQKAYYAVEREFYMLYGRNRYENYESFKNAKSKYLQRLGNRKLPTYP